MNLLPARPTIQIDNERIRVTRWTFPPKSETGWHRHELDYVVVPLTSGQLRLETAEGAQSNELVAGASYYRSKGAEHNVVNPGNDEVEFVEIELKT